jgi:hypothetical protein
MRKGKIPAIADRLGLASFLIVHESFYSQLVANEKR